MTVYLYTVNDTKATSSYFRRVFDNLGIDCISHENIDDISLLNIKENDLFLFIDPAIDWPLGIENLKCTKVCYLIDTHLDIQLRINYSKFFDYVFIAQKDDITTFKLSANIDAFWLPLACDVELHSSTDFTNPKKIYDVGFVGKLGKPKSERHTVLTTVLSKFFHNPQKSYEPFEMGKIYQQSKVVINYSINGDLNMRIFEALASNALLLTNRIENGLSDLFIDGVDFVSYTTTEEAISKLEYFLKNEDERILIAQNGFAKASNFHTYLIRWHQLIEITKSFPPNLISKNLINAYSFIYIRLARPDRMLNLFCRLPFSYRSYVNFLISLIKFFVYKIRNY